MVQDNIQTNSFQPIPKLVEGHIEELATLWERRSQDRYISDFTPQMLYELDERMEANLDGLMLDCHYSWSTCKASLDPAFASEFFVLTLLAFASKNWDFVSECIETLRSNPEMVNAYRSAIAWLPYEQVNELLKQLLFSNTELEKCLAVIGYAAHGEKPEIGFIGLLESRDNFIVSQALAVVGLLGLVEYNNRIVKFHDANNTDVRFNSVFSSVLLGNNAPLKKLAAFVDDEKYCKTVIQCVVKSLPLNNALTWLNNLTHKISNPGMIILGAGMLGDAKNMDELINAAQNDQYSRIAGKAIALITGVNLEEANLTNDSAVESGDDESEDIGLVADSGKIAQWWHTCKDNYQMGKRYLMGREVNDENLLYVLKHGTQLHRNEAAMELALRYGSLPLFNVRANAKVQQAKLAQMLTNFNASAKENMQ